MSLDQKLHKNTLSLNSDVAVTEEWMSPVFQPQDPPSEFRVLLIHPKQPLNLCGAGQISCVLGSVEINGYRLTGRDFDPNQMVPFCVPFRTAGSTHCTAEKIDVETVTKEFLAKRFASLNVSISTILTYILSQHYWSILVIGPPPPIYFSIETVLGTEFLRRPPAGLKYFRPITSTSFQLQFGDPLFTLERKVVVQRVETAIETEYDKRKRTIIMAVGLKNTGKSTFNKYMINRVLNLINDSRNNGKVVNVYFVDLDVGQPEFHPPGLVGVHKINKPLLSTSFFSQVSSLTSAFFYGSITPEVDTKHYKHVVQAVMEEFYRVSQSDDHSIAIFNNIGWVDYIGEEIMQHVISTVKPNHLISFQHRRATFNVSSIDPALPIRKYLIGGYIQPDNPNRFSPSTLRDYSLAAYLTQSYLRNNGVIVDSFNRCTVRVVSFNDIQLFFHSQSLVDDKFIFNTLNAASVALCSAPDVNFKHKLIRGRGDLPKNLVPFPNTLGQNPVLRCYGYAFIRAISLEERCFYVITPISSEVLKKVTIMALGHEIGTPKYIFQAQTTAGAPYLMSTNGSVDREFNQLSMPIKIVSCSKRR